MNKETGMRFGTSKLGWVLAALLALLMTACGSIGSAKLESLDNIQQQLLGDMQLPPGTTIDNSQSLILGSGPSWAGRIALHIPHGPSDTFTFFRDQFPASGWTGISSIKAKTSILVFAKQERTVTLEISDAGTLSNGSWVMLTAAPKGVMSSVTKVNSGAAR